MNPLHNPFSPGAGTPPPELAGRSDLLEHAMLVLARVVRGRSEKSMILIGLRGTGKTVLLRQVVNMALENNYHALMIEAHENKSLPELLLPELRRVLFELDVGERVSAKVKKAIRIFKSFVSSIKLNVKFQEFDFGIDIDPEKGIADSGDLELDLANLLVAIGEASKERETAVAIVIDELQYLDATELSALIMAQHKITQQALPVVLFGGGLPQLTGLMGDSKSYSERLFDFPELASLNISDAKMAIKEPALRENVEFSEEALEEIVRVTQGYPYFLQEWGYQTWNYAKKSPVTLDDVNKASEIAITRLDQSFFRMRFDRLTQREKVYLRALAECGAGIHRSTEVAEHLDLSVQKTASLRHSLIKKGMIYSPRYGELAFTVPLFEEFMKRTMPLIS